VTDKKWGKGKEKIDDEDVTFQRMVAKVSRIVSPFPPPLPFYSFFLYPNK